MDWWHSYAWKGVTTGILWMYNTRTKVCLCRYKVKLLLLHLPIVLTASKDMPHGRYSSTKLMCSPCNCILGVFRRANTSASLLTTAVHVNRHIPVKRSHANNGALRGGSFAVKCILIIDNGLARPSYLAQYTSLPCREHFDHGRENTTTHSPSGFVFSLT